MRKWKVIIARGKLKCSNWKKRFNSFTERNWDDTGTLLYWVVLLLFSVSVGIMSGKFMKPIGVGMVLMSVVTFIVSVLILWFLKKIVKLALRNGITEFLTWLLLCFLCIMVFTGDSEAAGETENTIFAVGISIIFAMFLKSIWAVCAKKVRTKAIFIMLTVTGIPTLAVIGLLCTGGFSDNYIEEYQKLASVKQLSESESADMQKALKNGDYTVETITYGTSEQADIMSNVTDISYYAENEGIQGYFKEKYQGYSLKEVPMAGIVWYPKEKTECPTLFIIHGNHNWLTDSYLGYEYLGTYLASHGYVVVSVDENACNGLSGENDARAALLLENMRQLKKFNQQKNNPLYEKMDYENLALAGHSRGGEAVTEAYLFNSLSYDPDNGNHRFLWDFSIKSIIAIAPVCGQYQPADREVELEDVNYLLLHGANDQDVSTFMGMEQYENIHFTGEKECIKSAVYIAGLNHGQFNSLWGKYDLDEPVNRMLNVENFLPQQEQDNISKIFIKTFLDKTLEDKTDGCTGLLTNCQKYQEILPKTLYVQSYDTSDAVTLCDFEEDVRLETGSLEGIQIKARNVTSWREEELTFSSGELRENYAMILKWEKPKEEAQIEISLPEWKEESKSIRFDIMNMEENEKEKAQALEVEVVVKDAEEKEACVEVSNDTTIYPAFPVRLNKLQYLLGTAEYKHQFQTVSVPLTKFEGIDTTNITEIILRFPEKNGKIAIDNVKLSQ